MKRIITILTFACLIMAATSCEHKDLCLDHSHIVDFKVVFDWQYAQDAAPASMSLYLFPEDDSESIRYEFTNQNGGTIRVPAGIYQAFCVNSDTEVIRYRNTDEYETFELITRDAETLTGTNMSALGISTTSVPKAEGTEDQRTAYSPDLLWCDHIDFVEIYQESETEQTVTFYPESIICNYTVEVRNAENLKYVTALSGSISGLSEGYLPATDWLGEDIVTIPFEVTYDTETCTVEGSLRTFGHCYDVSVAHKLVIYAVMTDGGQYYYTYDVTDQIHSAEDQRNIYIVIDGLPLPQPITNGGGFQPEVGEWTSVEIDIQM